MTTTEDSAVSVDTTADDPKYHVTSEFVDVPEATVKQLLKEYNRLEKLYDARKAALDAHKQKIIDVMHGAEVLRIEETGQEVFSNRVVIGNVMDTAKFRKEQPILAAMYQKVRRQRPFKKL